METLKFPIIPIPRYSFELTHLNSKGFALVQTYVRRKISRRTFKAKASVNQKLSSWQSTSRNPPLLCMDGNQYLPLTSGQYFVS